MNKEEIGLFPALEETKQTASTEVIPTLGSDSVPETKQWTVKDFDRMRNKLNELIRFVNKNQYNLDTIHIYRMDLIRAIAEIDNEINKLQGTITNIVSLSGMPRLNLLQLEERKMMLKRELDSLY